MIRSSNESVKVGLNFCKTQVGGQMENIVSKVWANWTCKKYKCSIIYLTETSHEKYIEKCWKNVIVNNGKSKKTMFRSETSPVDHMATVKAQRRRSVKWKLKAEIKTGCVHVKHCVPCNLWKHEAHTETRVQTEENSWTRRWNTICLFSSYTAAEKRQNDLWVQINNVDVMCHNMPDVGLVLCRALFWRCVKIPTCSTEWSSDQILLELHMKGFLCSLAPEAGGKQLDTHWVVTTKMKDVVPESTAQINTLNVSSPASWPGCHCRLWERIWENQTLRTRGRFQEGSTPSCYSWPSWGRTSPCTDLKGYFNQLSCTFSQNFFHSDFFSLNSMWNCDVLIQIKEEWIYIFHSGITNQWTENIAPMTALTNRLRSCVHIPLVKLQI